MERYERIVIEGLAKQVQNVAKYSSKERNTSNIANLNYAVESVGRCAAEVLGCAKPPCTDFFLEKRTVSDLLNKSAELSAMLSSINSISLENDSDIHTRMGKGKIRDERKELVSLELNNLCQKLEEVQRECHRAIEKKLK